MHARSFAMLTAAAVGVALSLVAEPVLGQPMPLCRKRAGILVADSDLNKIMRVRDLNNNGNALDAGEITVFFDGTNASGVTFDSSSRIFQSADGTVYLCDLALDKVIAVRDNNLDGDANDAGEARVFFSAAGNFGLFTLPTPQGVTADASGAIYIANAGAGASTPQDGVLRLLELPATLDGDCEDTGESSLWLNSSALYSTSSNPFGICSIGNTIYYNEWGFPNAAPPPTSVRTVRRTVDTDNSGTIEASECTTFITDGDFGVGIGDACVTDGVSIYTHDRTGSVNPQRVYKLTDMDASETINAAGEVSVVWSEDTLAPIGAVMATSFDFNIGPGRLVVISSGSGAQDAVIQAIDKDNNGSFLDAIDETTVLVSAAAVSGFPSNLRGVSFYAWPCRADFNQTGGVSVQDIFDFLAAWFTVNPLADINCGAGVSVQDIFDFLASWFSGC